MKTHRDLTVWQKSITLSVEIYNCTKSFPKEELYGITSQIRRCAVSVPSNIAEGAARTTNKEFNHFLSIALGSLAELETQLIISNRIEYITSEDYNIFIDQIISIRKMISGLKKTVSSNG